MYQPRQLRLLADEVSAMQRDGTMHRDLEIAEWMEQSHPYGEYRAGSGAFVVVTPAGDLTVGPNDWIVRCNYQFLTCPRHVLAALTDDTPAPSLCAECCDPVPPAQLLPIPTGARLCSDCLLEHQLQLQLGATEHHVNWTETGSTNGRLEDQP